MVSGENPRDVVEQAFEEVWNGGEPDAVAHTYAEDCVFHFPRRDPLEGQDALREYVASLHTGFPDLQMRADRHVAEDDVVVTQLTATGTHEGTHRGLEPTGREVELSGVLIDRVEDGYIVETWVHLDTLGLMRQLGLVPEPNSG
jgi:steroid delta-isomerase-like uncharacterized protein